MMTLLALRLLNQRILSTNKESLLEPAEMFQKTKPSYTKTLRELFLIRNLTLKLKEKI